ncbi:hypothetical protein AN619_07930 [Thermotalea metallivorans]|uniref:DUF2273 domain-containing protein n=2 Tax=Thermotalea metallivorans TaxID=520762 RepID=A0A140L8C6_9FIRM|nr:hypothetical protein AN619_07930 [Thermotalea metallivorans]
MIINKEKIMDVLWHHWGKMVGMLTGLVFSLLVIFIGILKTIFIGVCIYIGYVIGKKIDNKEDLWEFLDRILPPGNLK